MSIQLLIEKNHLKRTALLRFTSSVNDVEARKEFSLLNLIQIWNCVSHMLGLKKLINKQDNIVIYRSYGGSLLLAFIKFFRIRFVKKIFDTDGLAIDEKIDLGLLSKNSIKYWLLSYLEKLGTVEADALVARHQDTVCVLRHRAGTFGDIPHAILKNGRDRTQFLPYDRQRAQLMKSKSGFSDSNFIVIYSGSVGAQYRFADMLALFTLIKGFIESAKFLILINDSISSLLPHLANCNLSILSSIHVKSAHPLEVQNYLEIADIGMCLRASLPSMKHVAPLKFREYLFCGLPSIVTNNTADSLVDLEESIFVLPEDISNLDLDLFSRWIESVRCYRSYYRNTCRTSADLKFDIIDDVNELGKIL